MKDLPPPAVMAAIMIRPTAIMESMNCSSTLISGRVELIPSCNHLPQLEVAVTARTDSQGQHGVRKGCNSRSTWKSVTLLL